MRCVKSEVVETRNGYTICREEDKKEDPLTLKPYGRSYVFYAIYDGKDGDMLDSKKTLREARRYADSLKTK